MKTAEKAAEKKSEAPFKFLLVDSSFRFIVCQPEENPREKFKKFHGRAPLKSALFLIPKDCSVYGDLNYTIPKDAPMFDWVSVKGWR